MKAGDIYLVEIPGSGGHEQKGIRPAVIVQIGENIDRTPTVLVVPFTTKIKASSFPFTFVVEPDSINNLSSTSVALVFQLRAIDKKRIKDKVGNLNIEDIKTLKQILKNIMEL